MKNISNPFTKLFKFGKRKRRINFCNQLKISVLLTFTKRGTQRYGVLIDFENAR